MSTKVLMDVAEYLRTSFAVRVKEGQRDGGCNFRFPILLRDFPIHLANLPASVVVDAPEDLPNMFQLPIAQDKWLARKLTLRMAKVGFNKTDGSFRALFVEGHIQKSRIPSG